MEQVYVDRLFNIRPLCFWALCIGITLCLASLGMLWAVLFVLCVLLFLFLCQYYHGRDAVLQFLGSSRVFFIGVIVLSLVALASFALTTISFTSAPSYAGTKTLSGTVETYRLRPIEDGVSYMTISDAKFGDAKLDGNVVIFINNYDPINGTKIKVGSHINITTRLGKAQNNDFNINANTRYTASTKHSAIQTAGQSTAPRHTILRYGHALLNVPLGEKNAELMYSMLFGDRSAIDMDLRNDFTVIGLAHVLAVSGLHVGVIIGLLMALLRVCHIRRKVQFPIVFVFLIFYIYLCNFGFPIIRASIMFLAILFNRIYLRNTDLLSSLCFAGILTMLIYPYAIFTVSFQSSYTCVVGIAIMYRPFEIWLGKLKWKRAPNWFDKFQNLVIASAAMCLCCDIALMPFMIKYFGIVPLYSLLSNMVLLPLFVICFQASVIAVVTYSGYFILYPINYLLTGIRMAMNFIANIPFNRLFLENGGLFFLAYCAAILTLSEYIFLRRRYKFIAATTFALVYALGFLV